MKCDRCGKETYAYIMSMFDTSNLCLPCKDKEERHPDYKEAKKAELDALRMGVPNFPGIGKPKGL